MRGALLKIDGGDIADGGEREDFTQLADASHLGRKSKRGDAG